MPRGDWGILAAFAGLAALFVAFGTGLYLASLNYPHEQRYQPYRYSAEQPAQAEAAAATKADAQPLQYRTPCSQPEGQGESDLCAQWRAANAAQDGAFWTKWGVWIGIIGSSLLLWQIILTRRAVEDTGEATEAMREANKLAIVNTRSTLRPYVQFGKTEIQDVVVGKKPTIAAEITQTGQTPAYKVQVRLTIGLVERDAAETIKIFGVIPSKVGTDSTSVTYMPPGGDGLDMNCTWSVEITDKLLNLINSGAHRFLIAGVIVYRDVWGKRHFTTMKCVSGVFINGTTMNTQPTTRGNIAN